MPETDIEQIVIACLQENLELSGEPVPPMSGGTKPATDLNGFDSLRTLEVLVNIEEKLDCELPPDKVFTGIKFEDVTVNDLVGAIQKVKRGGEK